MDVNWNKRKLTLKMQNNSKTRNAQDVKIEKKHFRVFACLALFALRVSRICRTVRCGLALLASSSQTKSKG